VVADAAIFLRAEPDELVQRLLARAEEDGRTDDNEATIRHRIEVYNDKTSPLREYYPNGASCSRSMPCSPSTTCTATS
jgi:adenylate kinase